ncbi:MAG: MBL fold metallo-hydrolase [Planctomycetota bacterium]|nr:MBL fold metallo-hydrolase [Planctomycetota bacterium]
MEVKTLVVGPIETNCHIASCGKGECMIVDPGGDGGRISSYVKAAGLRVKYIVNTHSHCDHILANPELKAEYPGAQILIHKLDAPALTDGAQNLSMFLGASFVSPPADKTISEGDTVEVGECSFKVIHVPGHTPGHICLVYEPGAIFVVQGGIESKHRPGRGRGEAPAIFCGDTLFAGGIGRSDFPGGSHTTLVNGIRKKIFALPDDTIVYSGHGPVTTVGEEKRTNPFF